MFIIENVTYSNCTYRNAHGYKHLFADYCARMYYVMYTQRYLKFIAEMVWKYHLNHPHHKYCLLFVVALYMRICMNILFCVVSKPFLLLFLLLIPSHPYLSLVTKHYSYCSNITLVWFCMIFWFSLYNMHYIYHHMFSGLPSYVHIWMASVRFISIDWFIFSQVIYFWFYATLFFVWFV